MKVQLRLSLGKVTLKGRLFGTAKGHSYSQNSETSPSKHLKLPLEHPLPSQMKSITWYYLQGGWENPEMIILNLLRNYVFRQMA